MIRALVRFATGLALFTVLLIVPIVIGNLLGGA